MRFWNSCFFHDPVDVGNLISGSSAFSNTSLNISKFMVHILLKPGLENFEHYFASMWDKCNCAAVWTFFGIALRRKWQSTPALLPGKSHGRRSLIGYSPWGHKESDMTERLHFTLFIWEWKLTLFSPVATAEFSKFAGILSAALSQYHLSGFEIAQLEFHPLH